MSVMVHDFGFSLEYHAYGLSAHVSSISVAPDHLQDNPTNTDVLSGPSDNTGTLGATAAISSSSADGDVMMALMDNPLCVPTKA